MFKTYTAESEPGQALCVEGGCQQVCSGENPGAADR